MQVAIREGKFFNPGGMFVLPIFPCFTFRLMLDENGIYNKYVIPPWDPRLIDISG